MAINSPHNDHDYLRLPLDLKNGINSSTDLGANLKNDDIILEYCFKTSDQNLGNLSSSKKNNTQREISSLSVSDKESISSLLEIKNDQKKTASSVSILDKLTLKQNQLLSPIKYKLHSVQKLRKNPVSVVNKTISNESKLKSLSPASRDNQSSTKSDELSTTLPKKNLKIYTKKNGKKKKANESDNANASSSPISTNIPLCLDEKKQLIKQIKKVKISPSSKKSKINKPKNKLSKNLKKNKILKSSIEAEIKNCSSKRNTNTNKNLIKKKNPSLNKLPSIRKTKKGKKSSKSNASAFNHIGANLNRRNPFELIECKKFEKNMTPFFVKLKLDTLAIMDLHSHCLKTEVIGLLGGFYCPITRTLHIQTAEPCPSFCDDSIRCEIDPVSQAAALEKLELQNFQVVGWYHSHPTFLPDPSLRDIDTQIAYQRMFKQCPNGLGVASGRPYVAFIFSPFLKPQDKVIQTQLKTNSYQIFAPISSNTIGKKFYANDKLYNYVDYDKLQYRYFTPELNAVLASTYKCFWVLSNEESGANEEVGNRKLHTISASAIPYEIQFDLAREENLIPSIAKKLSPMCQWIAKDYLASVVNLSKPYLNRIGSIFSITHLEKIIASLSYHLQHTQFLCSDFECERIRQECIAILVEELLTKNSIQ